MNGIQWAAITISLCAIGLSAWCIWQLRRVDRSRREQQAAEFKRRWVEAHGRRRPAVSHTDPVEPPGGGAEKV